MHTAEALYMTLGVKIRAYYGFISLPCTTSVRGHKKVRTNVSMCCQPAISEIQQERRPNPVSVYCLYLLYK